MRKSQQPKITNWAMEKRECSATRAQHLTELVTNCVIKDLLPLGFCEGEGIKELMAYCEPQYLLPTSKTIKTHLLDKFEVGKRQIFDIMSKFTQIPAITCDAWTNAKTVGFITIMVHYINENWRMEVYNLVSPAISDRHTATNLAEILTTELEKANLQSFCATHDTAANMNAALSLTDRVVYDIGCLAHLLSLLKTQNANHQNQNPPLEKYILSFRNFERENIVA